MGDIENEDSNDWVYCNPTELRVAPPFNELFQINAKLLADVTEDMRQHGFKAAYPLVVWRAGNIVVDGHTRRQAAIKASIKDVPVCYEDFDSEDDAVIFAIKSQVKRRNLTEPELLRSIQELDKRRVRGGDHKSEKSKASRDAFDFQGSHNKSAAETGAILGISQAKVERARVALNDPEVKEKVLKGEKTINAGWKEASAKNREKKKTEPKKKTSGNGKPNLSDYPMPKPAVPPPPILVLERTAADEEYLQSFPLRSKVNADRFDDDALLYREFKGFLKGLRARLAEIVGPRSPVGRSLLHSELHSLATVLDIEEWIQCPKCDGNGICKKCNNGGYVIH